MKTIKDIQQDKWLALVRANACNAFKIKRVLEEINQIEASIEEIALKLAQDIDVLKESMIVRAIVADSTILDIMINSRDAKSRIDAAKFILGTKYGQELGYIVENEQIIKIENLPAWAKDDEKENEVQS